MSVVMSSQTKPTKSLDQMQAVLVPKKQLAPMLTHGELQINVCYHH